MQKEEERAKKILIDILNNSELLYVWKEFKKSLFTLAP